jgi:hypothetical protein
VPTNHKAGYWKQLRSNSQGCLQLNDPKIAFEHSQAPLAAHTVFLVDFGGTDSTSPCCGQECVRRGRQPRWEPHEEAELKELGVRSVVLASGTLSPLDSYAAELRIPFRVRLENPHVVSARQVLIGVVAKGPSGKPLNSSFQFRSTPEYKRELGNTIVNALCHIPDGVLVFFPSYGAMTEAVTHWREADGGDAAAAQA